VQFTTLATNFLKQKKTLSQTNKQTNKQTKLGESFLFEKIGHFDTKQQQQIERAN
jgi:hypothetical protein